jgi:hypothetical protein
VRLSITPAACRPSAVSWIDAIRGLRYCFLVTGHLQQHSRRNHSRNRLPLVIDGRMASK